MRRMLRRKTACKQRRVKYLLVKRGDIYYADLSPVVGSEQGGLRPVLIVQNDVGNKYSPTVIAAAITSQMNKSRLPTHIGIYAEKYGLAKDSVILLEQIRTIDKRRLKEKIGHMDDRVMDDVNEALYVSFGLDASVLAAASAERSERAAGEYMPEGAVALAPGATPEPEVQKSGGYEIVDI